MNKIFFIICLFFTAVYSQSYTDIFNRSDSINVAGKPWKSVPNTDVPNVNGSYVLSGNSCLFYFDSTTSDAQYSSIIDDGYYGWESGPAIRVSATGGYFVRTTPTVKRFIRYTSSGNSETQIGADITDTPTEGDSLTLTASNDTLRLYRGSTLLGYRVEATYSTGRAGAHIAYSTITRWYGGGLGGGCTAGDATQYGNIVDTVGNTRRWLLPVSGTNDSIGRYGTWPDSTAFVNATANDSMAARWKAKFTKATVHWYSKSCTGTGTDIDTVHDTITIVGTVPAYSNAPFSFTVNQAISTQNITSMAGVDSVVSGTLPTGLSLNKTTGAITGTPTATQGATDVKFVSWNNGWKVDSANISFTITAAATYSVTYNGNSSTGGTPPTDGNAYTNGQTVTTLGNTGSLVRTGYTFNAWNTAANGSGTARATGSTWSIGAANVTLYAQWTRITYTNVYNANGGTGTMTDASSPYDSNATVTVLSNSFTRTNYTVDTFNTAANGSGTSYAPAATFNIRTNTTLYAKWRPLIIIDSVTSKEHGTNIYVNDTLRVRGRGFLATAACSSNGISVSSYVFVDTSLIKFKIDTAAVFDIGICTLVVADQFMADTIIFTVQANPVTQFTLTMASGGSHSTTTPSIGAHTYDSATAVTIASSPSVGYRHVRWNVSVGTAHFNSSDSTRDTMLTTHTLTDSLRLVQYSVTVNNDGHGTTVPSGAHTVDTANAHSIAATASGGYHFTGWTLISGSGAFGNASLATTTFAPNSNATIQANFEADGTPLSINYVTNPLTINTEVNFRDSCSISGSTPTRWETKWIRR